MVSDYDIIRLVNKNKNVTVNTNNMDICMYKKHIKCRPSIKQYSRCARCVVKCGWNVKTLSLSLSSMWLFGWKLFCNPHCRSFVKRWLLFFLWHFRYWHSDASILSFFFIWCFNSLRIKMKYIQCTGLKFQQFIREFRNDIDLMFVDIKVKHVADDLSWNLISVDIMINRFSKTASSHSSSQPQLQSV